MPNRVQALDDALINKIAAGEVVERPASVLKELVENAMDAGATRIEVMLDEGGRRRILVRDNGSGMPPDDALLALKRHTTSKITSAQDLFQVKTMGFRGEALASISSVSRFTLQTMTEGQESGIRIEFADGKQRQQAWSGACGTEITVDDLFYNVPARQAFLRAAATEYSYCAEYLQALALARPDVEIILGHNGRETLRAPIRSPKRQSRYGEKLLKQRFVDVFPKENVDQMLYFNAQDKFGSFEALISSPGYERAQSKHMHTFVNGRWVKDKTLRYGIVRGYHSHLLKGKYPVCALYVQIDPSLIDVNVHPAKTEVRFQYGGELQSLIALQIREQLRKGAWANPGHSDSSSKPLADPKGHNSLPAPKPKPGAGPALEFDLSFSPSPMHSSAMPAGSSFGDSFRKSSGVSSRRNNEVKTTVMSFDGSGPLQEELRHNPKQLDTAVTEDGYQIPWAELNFIGSYAKCYLMFEWSDFLLVIDQHAFHERILFERLTNDYSILQQSQPLLVPEVIALPKTDVSRLKDRRDTFYELGFDLAFPSDSEVELKALPSLLFKRDPEVLIHDLIHADEGGEAQLDLTGRVAHQLLSTMACHAAVRAGESLDEDDIRQLVQEAQHVDFYHNCPHGRRVFKWWKKSQVEGWFDR